jgi:hypothetical protein
MSIRRETCCQFIKIALWLFVGLSIGQVKAQPARNLQPIIKAWQDRQDRVQSARFSWIETETVVKGYITNFLADPIGAKKLEQMGIPAGSIVPPTDMSYKVPSSLCLSDVKVRYAREDQQWSAKENGFVVQPYLVVFDGDIGKTLLRTGTPYTPWPSGTIQRRNLAASSLYLSPLIMTFRAMQPDLRLFNLEKMLGGGHMATIDGTSCVEFEARSGNSLERAWLAPSRQWTLLRYLTIVSEQPRTKVDIHYRNDLREGWIPQRWEVSSFGPQGKLERSMRATMTSCEINAHLEREEFDIVFPAGTHVADLTDPKRRSTYIVREGDRKRTILPSEIGASYEELVSSEPRNRLLSWPLLSSLAVGVSAAALLLWRRRILRRRALG